MAPSVDLGDADPVGAAPGGRGLAVLGDGCGDDHGVLLTRVVPA